jgi:hypothetical protein
MRGYVYRPGRRRTRSVVLAMGVAAALAGGVSATANARPAHAAAKPARAAGAAHTTLKPAPVVAHATGHKIA